jgi:hypothetical protein
MVRQGGPGYGVLGVHLAAEKLIMLGDVRIDGEAVRISERPPNLSHLIVCQFRHIYSDAIQRNSNHRKSVNPANSMFI